MSEKSPVKAADAPATTVRVVPVRLAKRGDAAHSLMLSRVLPDNGVSRLDVAAFNSAL